MLERFGAKSIAMASFGLILLFPAVQLKAAVTLVEANHVLKKLVDSIAPLHPSQSMLDTACAAANLTVIESIGVNPTTGTLYVQLRDMTGTDSCIFSISPTGVVTLINPSTGFIINERGTDLHFDPTSGLLLTKDDSPLFTGGTERIATVVPVAPGTTGTYLSLAPMGTFFANTFGMDFSAGVGGSDVAAGQVVFTSDAGANGIYSGPTGGLTNHLTPAVAGDDMVIQPDGDWVHVADFNGVITAYSATPPHNATPSPTGLNLLDMFLDEGLAFIYGSRATVCDSTGDLYVSYSGTSGGSGIFRIDETLTTATLVLTILEGNPVVAGNRIPRGGGEPPPSTIGLQDLIVGPSSASPGNSLYFTVHDAEVLGEQVWEVTLPECGSPTSPAPALSRGAMAVLLALLLCAGAVGVRRQRA